jgi:hypothetical protein
MREPAMLRCKTRGVAARLEGKGLHFYHFLEFDELVVCCVSL